MTAPLCVDLLAGINAPSRASFFEWPSAAAPARETDHRQRSGESPVDASCYGVLVPTRSSVGTDSIKLARSMVTTLLSVGS